MNESDRIRLIADNEQDKAACVEWWRESCPEVKAHIWNILQGNCWDVEPEMQVIQRMAQLKFAEMAEEFGISREATE